MTTASGRVNPWIVVVGLLITAPLVAVLYSGFGKDPKAVPFALDGKPAPQIQLVDLDGNAFDLAQHRGKPVVLNFWSTWCQPCKIEHPLLVRAPSMYPDVTFLGVIYSDEPSAARRYLKTAGTSYPHLVDEQGRERASYRVPYGAKLLKDEGDTVERGDRLAEWDPYTRPIISEKEGTANYMDLVDGVSMRDITDEATGLSYKTVIEWKQQPKGTDLRPRITLRDKKGEVITLESGAEARYFLSVDAILSVEAGETVHAGDVLARIPLEGSKTRDITGGLPRVAELFEARKPKDFAIISDTAGRVEFGKDYKNKRRLFVHPEEKDADPVEYLLPKGKPVAVQEGDIIERGDALMDGNPVPHDILRVMGVEALANYLIDEIQEVYRLQGVKINDKHIEVIARQMLQKVEIAEPGETTFLTGELVDRLEFDAVNEKALAEGLKPAEALPVLQGITKASLQTQSFISAASFQETTRVLTEAAVSGKVDSLIGLKENVIVGRLIPAGTGAFMNKMRTIAADRDREIAELSQAEEAAQLPPAEETEEVAEPAE